MRLSVVLEHRFTSTSPGAAWTRSAFPYEFWSQYLGQFDHVQVIARCSNVPKQMQGDHPVTGPGVSFFALPHYVGAAQFAKLAFRVRASIMSAIEPTDAVVFRVSSILASMVAPSFVMASRPFGVEVVGDPYQVFSPGVVHHPLRPAIRWGLTYSTAWQCRNACAAAYVTEYSLQKRYPCPRFTTSYSSVRLDDHAFSTEPRRFRGSNHRRRLVSIGTFEQLYKGHDTLVEAVARLAQDSFDVCLTIVGDGRFRTRIENQASELGVHDRITFTGQLPAGDLVRSQLDDADLFVLASRTEGLPRVIIEAMARGLPCVGTTAGGTPELLQPDEMVEPNDPAELAEKIAEVLQDPARLEQMSISNLEKSRRFHQSLVQLRRNKFLTVVRERTADWNSEG